MTSSQFLTEIKAYAKEANNLYFDGELDLNKIHFVVSTRMFRTLGLANHRFNKRLNRVVYSIKMASLLSGTDTHNWHNVLVHEMVHIWQYMNGYFDHHGNSFLMKAAQIGRIDPDMHIERLCHLNDHKNRSVLAKVLAVKAARSSAATKKTQYLVSKNGKFFFITCIKVKGIATLQKKGYSVFRLKKQITRVQNTRNLEKLLEERRYYSKEILLKNFPELPSLMVKLNPTK